jgi:hypothetical protein
MNDKLEKWKGRITASRKALQFPRICRNDDGKLENAKVTLHLVLGPNFKLGTAPNSQQDG